MTSGPMPSPGTDAMRWVRMLTSSGGLRAAVADRARDALGRFLDEARPRGLHALRRRRHGEPRHERAGVVAHARADATHSELGLLVVERVALPAHALEL